MRKHWHAFAIISLCVASCRYRYELLPSHTDQVAAGSAGEASSAAGAEGVAAAPTVGGNDQDGAGTAGNGEGGTAPAAGDSSGGAGAGAGSGGSGNFVPPDMTLCSPASFGAHDYLLCQELRSWADANGGCLAIGMHLVRVDDADEDQWLFTNASTPNGSTSRVWIGGNDQAVEGEWRWSDGDLFWLGDDAGSAQGGLFTAWYFREPNDVDGEDCAVLETNSAKPAWYDAQCHLALAYVCESP